MRSEERAKRYAQWKRRLLLVDLGLNFGFLIGVVAGGFGVRLSGWVMRQVPGWPLQTALYVGILGLAFEILGFPLNWVQSFWLEHRFELSPQTFSGWLKEYGKRCLVGGVLGLILVEGLVFLIQGFPESWWKWATLGGMAWSVFLTWVAPMALIPIFYRQKPLQDESLRQRLESLLARCRVRVRGIFEVDLSRTTRKANACLCGLGGTRRVLVSDTLLASHPPEEVEVVLAHEVGHHRLCHLGILIVVGTAATGLSCFAADQAVRALGIPLGMRGVQDLAALPLMGLALFLLGLALMPVTNGISRLLEAQADRFALRATGNPQAFIATMRRLGEQNLSEFNPPRWVEWILYDHPSITKRIALAEGLVHNFSKGKRSG